MSEQRSMSPWADDAARAAEIAEATPATVKITMKAGGDYDAPWIVIEAPSVCQAERALADVFGWLNWDPKKTPLADAVLAMAKALAGKWNVVETFDARFIGDDGGPIDYGVHPEDTGSAPQERRGGFVGPGPYSNLSENEIGVLCAVQACSDVAQVRALWGQYAVTLNNQPLLLEAWKARGRELAAAAKSTS